MDSVLAITHEEMDTIPQKVQMIINRYDMVCAKANEFSEALLLRNKECEELKKENDRLREAINQHTKAMTKILESKAVSRLL